MMVRAKPGLNDEAKRIEAILALERPALVFLHSDAVEAIRALDSSWLALAEQEGLDLVVCSAAWARRGDGALPPVVNLSSLIRFWAAQLESWSSLKSGGDATDDAVQVHVAEAQDLPCWKETLEVILAAATLEIPTSVTLSERAWQSMQAEPEVLKAWRQLTDFDLARIKVPEGINDGAAQDLGASLFNPVRASDGGGRVLKL